MDRFEKFLKDRGAVWVDWYPGDADDDLHGFVTAKERDAFEKGKSGPFRRVVRDHHKLGPVPDDILAVRAIYFKGK